MTMDKVEAAFPGAPTVLVPVFALPFPASAHWVNVTLPVVENERAL
jgi:hypothetical protein